MPEYASRNLVVAACIVFAMGAHWLWTDYVHPTSGQEDRAYCPLTETPPPLPAHLPMRMSPGSLVTSADPRGCCGSPSVPAYDSGMDASRVLFIRPALFFGKPDRVSTLPNDGFRPTRRFDIALRQRPRLTTSEPCPHPASRRFRFSGKHRRISKRAPFRPSAEYSSTSRQALFD